jgi:hypothetical protein
MLEPHTLNNQQTSSGAHWSCVDTKVMGYISPMKRPGKSERFIPFSDNARCLSKVILIHDICSKSHGKYFREL